MPIPILDLHQTKHENAYQKIYHFLFVNAPPVKIITGKSSKMRQIVFDCLDELELTYHDENWINFGCLIILDAK